MKQPEKLKGIWLLLKPHPKNLLKMNYILY
ncbi:hypothetical protein CGSHi22121_08318 [Haemophilus influenzae 22.1-21]|nr:hypothetical protein CGSHi22121_08318 [Haemophilus influenzae 22.1-21]